MDNPAQVLQGHLDKLKADDRQFAQSLLRQLSRKGGLSDKQWHWVNQLAERALNPGAALPQTEVGSFAGVAALFKKANGALKHPTITLALPCGLPVQLHMAGAGSKFPGSINVTDGKPFGTNVWYGRVSPDGVWAMSPKCTDEVVVDQIYDLLVKLSEHPAETAAAYGKLTGHCCFCLRKLDDERSVAVGYGPVCAKRWGLPWGSC